MQCKRNPLRHFTAVLQRKLGSRKSAPEAVQATTIKTTMTITMTKMMMAKGKNHCTDKETTAKTNKNAIMRDGNGDGDGNSNGNSNGDSNGNGHGSGNETSTNGSVNATLTPPPSNGKTKTVSAQAKLIGNVQQSSGKKWARPSNTMPCDTMPCDTMPYNTMPCDTMPCNTMPCNGNFK